MGASQTLNYEETITVIFTYLNSVGGTAYATSSFLGTGSLTGPFKNGATTTIQNLPLNLETSSSTPPPIPTVIGGLVNLGATIAQSASPKTSKTTKTTKHTHTSRPIPGNSVSTTSQTSPTAQSAQNSAANQKPTVSPSSNVQAGPIAGAAVGGFVVAAILATLITWLVLRSRYRKRLAQQGAGNQYGAAAVEKRADSNTKPRAVANTAAIGAVGDTNYAWTKHLPQSAADSTLAGQVKTLFNNVEQHVDNYYRNNSVNITGEMQIRIEKFDSPHLDDTAAALLQQDQPKASVIKHCLANFLACGMSPDSSLTFLPLEFASLPQALMDNQSPDNKKPVAFEKAYSQWRVLTAYLRPDLSDDPNFLRQRNEAIASNARSFCAAFEPWASTTYSIQDRERNIFELMKSAAELGALIFAQPSEFRWVWDVEQKRAIVVTPGFAKVRDEKANELSREQMLVVPGTADF